MGKIELIVDGDGDPLCIIELIEVEIKPFNAVDEQFAFDYGEGDRSLALLSYMAACHPQAQATTIKPAQH